MKKFLIIILSFLITIVFAGCAYDPSGGNPSGGNKPPDTGLSGNPSDDSLFTVSLLKADGSEFEVYSEFGTTAIFTSRDDGSVVEAPFNTHGVASVEGLDGDYTVTVRNLDDKYAYNPNVYTVTNDDRNVQIEILNILPTKGGDGSYWYSNVIELPREGGIYRIPVKSLTDQVYCQFAPATQGIYYIESLADINANEINPRMEVHDGNANAVFGVKVYLNGTEDMPSSDFTRNFRYTIDAYSGSFCCPFILTCDSKVGYPAYVDLYVVRAGDYDFGEEEKFELVIPSEVPDEKTPDYSTPFRFLVEDDKKGVLRGSRVGYNETDGYYHLLNEDADGNMIMTETILYAKISGNIIGPNGDKLVNFQDMPNPDEGGAPGGSVGSGRGINLLMNGKNYTLMVQGYEGLAAARYPADYQNYADKEKYKSYIYYANSDGMCAVTRELKDFLQTYSSFNHFFYDGAGTAEYMGYNSTDPDQWLFACGYYA